MSSAPSATPLAARVVQAPLVVYQRWISPGLPRRCRYEPTCSHYALGAISRYGIMRGLVLAAWRLVRCNPWSPGGFDPPEAQRVFRVPARGPLDRAQPPGARGGD